MDITYGRQFARPTHYKHEPTVQYRATALGREVVSLLKKKLAEDKKYVVALEVVPDDPKVLGLPLPDELIERMGWTEDTVLEGKVTEQGIEIKEVK